MVLFVTTLVSIVVVTPVDISYVVSNVDTNVVVVSLLVSIVVDASGTVAYDVSNVVTICLPPKN